MELGWVVTDLYRPDLYSMTKLRFGCFISQFKKLAERDTNDRRHAMICNTYTMSGVFSILEIKLGSTQEKIGKAVPVDHGAS
jgi:predicted GNAT family N-acyltransferase